MVSTPNAPGGLFQKIEQEPFDSCIYKKLFLDFTYGLGKIYTQQEIDNAKMSPSFPREYQLQYQGLIGNVFSTNALDKCQEIQYDPSAVIPNAKVSIGIDPSFGSSKFGIVATRFVGERIQVVIAEEHDRPDFDSMINRVFEIKNKIGMSACYVDAANPEIWKSLKVQLSEESGESYVFSKLAELQKERMGYQWYHESNPYTFLDKP
jgi:hypothetical protein